MGKGMELLCPALKPHECAHREPGGCGVAPLVSAQGQRAGCCLLPAALSGRPACGAASPQKQIDYPQSEPRSNPGLEHHTGTEHLQKGHKIRCESK